MSTELSPELLSWMDEQLDAIELPPDLREHQREVKAEVKAMYQQRHGRDTLLQMRAELLSVEPADDEDAENRCELLAWMDEKLEAIDTAEAATG